MGTEIRQNTIVEQVMERIKTLITSDEYNAGDKLPPENELAENWGVSRSSIREAVKVFNYLGVLESHAGRGTFICQRTRISSSALSLVALLGSNETHEISAIRASIELWSILNLSSDYAAGEEKAVEKMRELHGLVDQMKNTAGNNGMIELDIAFHRAIIIYSENELFTDIFDLLRSFIYDMDAVVHTAFESISQIVSSHGNLLSFIEKNDTEAIIDYAKDHHYTTMQKFHSTK